MLIDSSLEGSVSPVDQSDQSEAQVEVLECSSLPFFKTIINGIFNLLKTDDSDR